MPLIDYGIVVGISEAWFNVDDVDLPIQAPFLGRLHIKCDSPDFPEEQWPLDSKNEMEFPCGTDPNFSPLDDIGGEVPLPG